MTALLRGRDAQSASVSTTSLYRYRAEALAALGCPTEAYADLNKFVDFNKRWNETEGAKQAAILCARFLTDRQIHQSHSLQAALAFAHERERN